MDPSDILDPITAGTPRPSESYPRLPVEPDMVLLHRSSGIRGNLHRFTGDIVDLRDRHGGHHQFRNLPGAFAYRGETVTLVRPSGPGAPGGGSARGGPGVVRSASGALVSADASARVARASRLWVEGDHDARLLERVWGDELRELAIVVEPLGGLDRAAGAITSFRPGPGREVVILADHLVPGSKESRIAAELRAPHVHVVGHEHVDIWECVRPSSLGITAWPHVPRPQDWKTGVCEQLGWGSPRDGWRRVLASVDDLSDLEPTLVNAVERALDLLAPP